MPDTASCPHLHQCADLAPQLAAPVKEVVKRHAGHARVRQDVRVTLRHTVTGEGPVALRAACSSSSRNKAAAAIEQQMRCCTLEQSHMCWSEPGSTCLLLGCHSMWQVVTACGSTSMHSSVCQPTCVVVVHERYCALRPPADEPGRLVLAVSQAPVLAVLHSFLQVH